MWNLARLMVIACAWLAGASPALADDEASNVAHVVASPYGRCYARSVPRYIYDPADEPRQQGRTTVYRVEGAGDEVVNNYDWFSQRLFIRCSPVDDIIVVRTGPWHRGHDPDGSHLALAFYRGGKLVKSYSALEIAGGAAATVGGTSKYKNVSASVSHYTVFSAGPEMVRVTTVEGAYFTESWVIEATTIDGRRLSFDMATGEVR